MTVENIEVAERFRVALEEAVRSGELETVYPLLAPDVEWVTPQRVLHGIDEVKTHLTWISPPETFDFAFSDTGWVDHGDGRLVGRVHQVYRLKDSGEFAYERDRRVELEIRDGKICRYEMRIVG